MPGKTELDPKLVKIALIMLLGMITPALDATVVNGFLLRSCVQRKYGTAVQCQAVSLQKLFVVSCYDIFIRHDHNRDIICFTYLFSASAPVYGAYLRVVTLEKYRAGGAILKWQSYIIRGTPVTG